MNQDYDLSQYVLASGLNERAFELSDSEGKFKRYSKMLAAYGEYVDPRGRSKKMILDKAWAEDIVANAKSGPIKMSAIPTPLGHPQTSAELAALNKGWMVDMETRDDGLYGIFEIRDAGTADSIDKGLINDTSVAFDDDYQDKKTGKWYKNVLKHVGLVIDPYIKGMPTMEPVAMSDSQAVLMFSEGAMSENNDQEKEDHTMETVDITNERDFDVEVVYTEADEEKKATVKAGEVITVPADQEETVKKQINDAVDPADAEVDDELSDEEKKAKELAEREAAVAKKEAELSEKAAEARFAELLAEHKVVPAQKDAFIALSAAKETEVRLSDDETKTVDVLLSEFIEASPKLNLTDEKGANDAENGGGKEEPVELSEDEREMAETFGLTKEQFAAEKEEK